MFELNKLRRGRGSPARKQGNPSYAAVSLSDLRCTGGTDYNLNSYAHCTPENWLIDTLPVQSMAKQLLNAAETSALSDDLAALRPGVRTDTEDTN